MLPYDQIADRALLADLAARRIDLLVAVTPERASTAAPLVHACRAAGVGIGLWPMMDDRDGRWPSAANARPFIQFCRDLLASLKAAHAVPDEIAIDLEPPINRVRAMLAGSPRALLQLPGREGMQGIADLVHELRGQSLRVSAAVTPLVALPSPLASRGWQRLLGTPVDGLAFDTINVMAYTSLFEVYSRGLFRRRDARAMLHTIAATTARRWGRRAAISLGVVGPGALGDERAYRTPAELAEDVALAEAAGIEEIVLFALDGLAARPPREAWLEALCATGDPIEATPTPRSRAALAASSAVGVIAAGLTAIRQRDRAASVADDRGEAGRASRAVKEPSPASTVLRGSDPRDPA